MSVNGNNGKALFAWSLMAILWEPLFALSSCAEQFVYFAQNLQDLFDKFMTHKMITKRQSDKLWIMTKYKDLI